MFPALGKRLTPPSIVVVSPQATGSFLCLFLKLVIEGTAEIISVHVILSNSQFGLGSSCSTNISISLGQFFAIDSIPRFEYLFHVPGLYDVITLIFIFLFYKFLSIQSL